MSAQLSLLDPTPAEMPPTAFRDANTYRVAEVRAQIVREDVAPSALERCDGPGSCAEFFRRVIAAAPWFDAEKECVALLLLNARMRVVGWNCVSLGSSTSALAHPREVLRMTLVSGARSFVMMHNHPGGDPAPSNADLQVTRQMRDAARIVDVDFQDHVIIGTPLADPLGRGYYSFREAGIL